MDKLIEQALLENKIVRYIPIFVQVLNTYKRLLDESEQQVKNHNTLSNLLPSDTFVICPNCGDGFILDTALDNDC